jgi:hypothetical protein
MLQYECDDLCFVQIEYESRYDWVWYRNMYS